MWNLKGPQMTKAVLKKNKDNLDFLVSKLLQTPVNKIVWDWHKGRHTDQWNRIEHLEGNSNI